jgi:hypothetical protein
MIVEAEFAGALAVMERAGNTMGENSFYANARHTGMERTANCRMAARPAHEAARALYRGAANQKPADMSAKTTTSSAPDAKRS